MNLGDVFLFFLGVYIGQEFQDLPNINNTVRKAYQIMIDYNQAKNK